MSSASSLAEPLAATSPSERRATWLELFFDLVFAAAVAEASGLLGARYDGVGLLQFALPFFLVWWAWAGHTFFCTRFDTDDLGQRLLTVGQMFLVAVMASNTESDPSSREAGGFAAAYAAMRLLLACQYLRVRHPGTQATRRAHAAGVATAASFWLLSSLAPPPVRFGLWGGALIVEVLTPWVAGRVGPHHPPDEAHLPERFGLFTLIILGEAIAGIMVGMKHQDTWSPAAAGAAVFGLGATFAIWWAYFDTARAAAPRPVNPSQRRRLLVWLGAHLPLNLALVVIAVGIEHVVVEGGGHPLRGSGSALLWGGMAAAALALGVIGNTEDGLARRRFRGMPVWPTAVGVCGGLAWIAPRVAGVATLALLCGLVLAALVLSSRSTPPPRAA